MLKTHKIIGIINLILLPVLLFLAIAFLRAAAAIFVGRIGLILFFSLALFLNRAINFIKYYTQKPYLVTNFEKILLSAGMINAVIMIPFYLYLGRVVIGI